MQQRNTGAKGVTPRSPARRYHHGNVKVLPLRAICRNGNHLSSIASMDSDAAGEARAEWPLPVHRAGSARITPAGESRKGRPSGPNGPQGRKADGSSRRLSSSPGPGLAQVDSYSDGERDSYITAATVTGTTDTAAVDSGRGQRQGPMYSPSLGLSMGLGGHWISQGCPPARFLGHRARR